jgi:hypothetical protein
MTARLLLSQACVKRPIKVDDKSNMELSWQNSSQFNNELTPDEVFCYSHASLVKNLAYPL